MIEKREIPGYYLNITRYADELLAQVEHGLPGWPDRVKLMQANWIGKSEGVRFAFPHDIRDADGALIQDGKLWVFTTRIDTIMGVSFCAVAPEHPLAVHAASGNPQLAAFIAECKAGGTTEAELATRDKQGMRTGLFVTHPLSHEQLEVWVGNYVLMSYGDGAVMGVPAHDERDFAFAKKYGLPITQVIAVDGEHFSYDHWQDWYADKQRGITINSDLYSGLGAPAGGRRDRACAGGARPRRQDHAMAAARLGHQPPALLGHADPDHPLRGVRRGAGARARPARRAARRPGPRRQRQSAAQVRRVPERGLPDAAAGRRRRETDTMDTFVDSSWYFMRYCDPHDTEAMVGAGTQYWMPMDQYIGGIEHAILHLLYARFWTKVMRDLKLVAIDEPFTHLLTQGMVLNEAFVRTHAQGGKEYFWAADLDIVRDEHAAVVSATAKADGLPVEYEGWTTMSKSKNNGVDPQELIARYGADTARLFVMFASPPEQTLEWSDAGVEGAHRFLKRVWAFGSRNAQAIRGAGAGRAARRTRRGGPRAATRGAQRAAPGQLRLRAHAVQHRRLRRDEAAQCARGLQGATRRPCCARPAASCCGCSTRPART